MRTTCRFLVLAAAFGLTSPAAARDDSWYVEAGFGAAKVPEAGFEINDGIPIADAVETSFTPGWEASGVVGYDFGKVRIEAEGSYRRTRVKCITANTPIQGNASLATGPLIGRTCEGDAFFLKNAQFSDAWSVMANGIVDIGRDDSFQAYVGGGVGLSSVRHKANAHRLGPGWLDDTGAGFAWQALAGVRYPVTDSIDVGLRYRFFNVESVNLVENRPSARPVETRWSSHAVLVTVGYNFGGKR